MTLHNKEHTMIPCQNSTVYAGKCEKCGVVLLKSGWWYLNGKVIGKETPDCAWKHGGWM